ncbi:MAG: exopolysaccharide biosynthesis protein [Desulfohalobiaceae bacterium]
MGEILQLVGYRSFGPLMVMAGVVILFPLVGDIPGVPTIMAIFVMLVAGQLLFRNEHLWLPHWLLARSVPMDKVEKGVAWMRRPFQVVDRLLRSRLTIFTGRIGIYAATLACLVIAAAVPLMEFIPFSANLAGAALVGFGLSLIANDGLLMLLALAITGATFVLGGYGLF